MRALLMLGRRTRVVRASVLHVCLLLVGCETPLGRSEDSGGGRLDAGVDAASAELDATVGTDAPGEPSDAFAGAPDVFTPLGPPLARPPAPPPDHSVVVAMLASERPDLLAGSCLAMGGTLDFLFEAVRRLRAIDPRYGLVMRGGVLLQDRVGYYWGDGAPEGSSEIYVLDIIQRHCAGPSDPPAAPGWGDDTPAGGTWTIVPLGGPPPMIDAGPVPDASMPMVRPLPDARGVVEALAAERPDLLDASCVEQGGNNDFLFELVRRLRRMDIRWGLNWKRAVIGDMSQDVVNYYHGPGDPIEGSFDTYVIDVIGNHCPIDGTSPRPAWSDVTVLGSTGARWTLAGRTDLGP